MVDKPKKETLTIRISTNTYRKLRLIGGMGESFDDLIVRILEEYNRIKKSEAILQKAVILQDKEEKEKKAIESHDKVVSGKGMSMDVNRNKRSAKK